MNPLNGLVATARHAKNEYMKALKTGDFVAISIAAKVYHTAFDEVKAHTKWSLARLFEVINEGKDY